MRRALPLLCMLLSGCGFHPLYGASDSAAEANLPDIFVAVIPGRPGQLLRQDLQQHLAGSDDENPHGYTLRVSYSLDNEAIGIHGDNTSARSRVVGRATWYLDSVAAAPVNLASGSSRTVDGFNIVETQYFAATMALENTESRVARNLADNITTQVAIWFAGHPNGTTSAPGSTLAPPKPSRHPRRGFLGPQIVPGDSTQSPLQTIGPDGLPSSAIGRTAP
ncbi:hypothetical protein [Lichenicoccus sp.]|uniref:hypothetical protein n=1 Tax=Lichenicoccus sp. TaxID=2781899 RepID=UPI003D11880A